MKFVTANAITRGCLGVLLLLCVCSTWNEARGQSSDIAMPTPVQTNEVIGTIVARDIGDPRLTDHYYAFNGTPGDVLITIDSKNLNGDVDVFTTSGLRPLMKVTVYSSNSAPVTKGIYLRKREELIIRVEARTPNDEAGTYKLSFSGSFEPYTSGPFLVENQPVPLEDAVTTTGPRKGRRVSSVGARIEEPPSTEIAVAPTPEPTPTETPVTPAETSEANPVEAPEAAKVTPRPPARTARGRRGPSRRTRTPPPPKVEETAENAEPAAKPPDEEPTTSTTPTRRSTTRGGTARRAAEEQSPIAEDESGPRLVIETNDGTLVNRYMSSVRRVTVENGQVVVVGKDGKTERIALANVVRMSIAP